MKKSKMSMKRKILYGLIGLIVLAVGFNMFFGGDERPMIVLEAVPTQMVETSHDTNCMVS